ncbi:MAG: ATP-binding protein [Bacteroidota bacterium]
MVTNEQVLAKLTLTAREDYIVPALMLVKAIASKEGFTDKQLFHIETVTEEACLNVIQHAFEPGDEGSFDLIVTRQPGRIVIAIEDKGLPFDSTVLESGEQGGLGLRLMRGFADEVKFYSMGRNGKRVEMVKYLPREDPASLMTDADRLVQENKEMLSTEPVNFRMMTPADATGLTRCVYRTYGYSYGSDYIYNPAEVREMLSSGIIESFLAVNSADETVGHLALIYHKLGAMVAESGQAVVDTRFRGRKLFEQLKIQLLQFAKDKGLYGVYSEATTAHPYSQKGNITLGAVETGFMLGFAPESVAIKTIEAASKEMRLSGLFYFLKVNEEPMRTIYLPENHKTMIDRIISRIKMNRIYGTPETPGVFNRSTIIRSKIRPEWGHAVINLSEYGDDFVSVMKTLLREIKNQKISAIFIDLPLCSPFTPHYYKELETLGFSFSCFVPEYEDGDVIRMQYLNNCVLDPSKISVAAEFGKELLAYIMDDLKI